MDRFVAIAWDDRSTPLTQRAAALAENLLTRERGWTVALDAPCLTLFLRQEPGDRSFFAAMPNAKGAVIGPLFRRGEESKGTICDIPEADALRIHETDGQLLIRDFWGSYVAIWRSRDGAYHILRDPSGAQPCYHTHCAGIEILCSAVADIARIPEVHFSIDRDFVAGFLTGTDSITRHTGLKELAEVLPGERLTLERSRPAARSWAWSAPAIASQVRRQSFAEAVEQARETTEQRFKGWARRSDNIIVRLSGGLDSSAVAGLLRRHSTGTVTALHLVGKGYESQELRYARRAAEFSQLDLLEIDEEEQPADYRRLLANEAVLPRPTRQIFGATTDKLIAEACARSGATVAMTGHGGDIVFFQRSMSGSMSADDLMLNGPTSGFWQRCYGSAMLLERSVWGVASDSFSAAARARRNRIRHGKLSLHPAAMVLPDGQTVTIPRDYGEHPLSAEMADLPPAKAAHVRGLHALRDYHAQRSTAQSISDIHPLMAQPIVELALTTPTYLFGAGGADRSLERHAFRHVLPDEIYRRTSKGFVNHELTSLFEQNLPYFREIVMDGETVRLLDLDRARIEPILAPKTLSRERGLFDVMTLVATEVWLSSWNGLRRNAR